MLSQSYNTIIDCGINAPGHIIEVVDGINATDRIYLFQMMSNVELPGTNGFYTKMAMHSSTLTADVILDQ